ncbi:MAG: hypothetical protein KatS3mg076_1814 [Candidatus Binatia bacterium]|nr:MAG: hypothetical protein KatS3mg076_1814 [Candidatus Binatia bacterium]
MARRERAGRSEPSFRNAFLLFVLRFLGILFVLSALSTLLSIQNRLGPLERGLALAAEQGARLFGAHVVRHGNSLAVGGRLLEINHECTAFFVLLIYASFLFAYPATLAERLLGLVQGAVVLLVVNAVRLAGLAIVVASWPEFFDYFHEYFWQVLFLGLVTVLAQTWLNRLAVPRELSVLPR